MSSIGTASVGYNFKSIPVVNASKEFIDIVLSKTQRKTPTVVHARYAIKSIREFYMRKVKFAQQTFHDKLTQIIEAFPRLEDIHPFYADLINVLYDRDHYKLALGQINVARHLIDNLAKDYVRLLKYGDSLYRCKQLKRAALGRMCTLMMRQQTSLAYLEEVRQHLARLPSIDPNTRTLILTGFPNVGKSSFINKVTHANCEVQPYPFTTKSLFIGHMDYKYLRWQVIDTPGILDHPLEDRNTIEMQAVTALAHLNCCVLFFVDISEQCNYTIAQQISLFNSLRPLFANKPVVLVANKIDVLPFENLSIEGRHELDSVCASGEVSLIPMSNVSEEGILQVKVAACDKLLEHRVATKLSSKKVDDIANRIHITRPKPRDAKARPVVLPTSVILARQAIDIEMVESPSVPLSEHGVRLSGPITRSTRRTERDLEAMGGGPGVYNPDWRAKHFRLADDSWATDTVPEIMDGKNVADFVDPEIDERLAELEREEDELAALAEAAGTMGEDWELDDDQESVLKEIQKTKKLMKNEADLKKSRHKVVVPRTKREKTMGQFEEHLETLGIDHAKISERARSLSRARAADYDSDDMQASALGKRRGRSRSRGNEDDDSQIKKSKTAKSPARSASRASSRETSRTRSKSKSRPPSANVPAGSEGLKNLKQKLDVVKMAKKVQAKAFNLRGLQGESDRFIGTKMPRHLFSGKSGIGKSDRR